VIVYLTGANLNKDSLFFMPRQAGALLINSPFSDRKGDAGVLRGGERPLEGVGGNAVPPRGRRPPFIDERTALRAYRLKTKGK
jgi:hypothetical protein